MKVERLSLANFRGFEQINLAFESDITVIAGVNGVGKSGTLQVLATLCSFAIREITPMRIKILKLTDRDIQERKKSCNISAQFSIDNHHLEIAILRSRLDPEKEASIRTELRQRSIQKTEVPDNPELLKEQKKEERYLRKLLRKDRQVTQVQFDSASRQTKQKLRNQTNRSIALFFSTQRQQVQEFRTLPESIPLYTLASTYQNALESRPLDLGHFAHWYRVQQVLEEGRDRQRQQVLDALQRVIAAFLPDFENLRIETNPFVRFVVDKSGVPLGLNQLSDGERGLLSMILDITRRLSIANPELDDPIAEGKAVVLIDEIELHLHPTWQRRVLRKLTEIFKSCQFIVTTHSPQVLGEVESRCVRFLYFEDGKVKSWTPDRAKGLDSNRVLEELMDAKSRNAEIEQALNHLFRQIDNKKFDAAKQSIRELQETLKEDDPELTRARALLAFLEDDA